jgi:ABC-2 type transport system ATP-binding protein
VVVSSHDLADIEALADYVVVINDGLLVTEGALETMLGDGDTRVRTSDDHRAAEALVAAGFEARTDDGGLVVSSSEGSAIAEALARAGIYPPEIRPERSTWESVFLGLTGTTVR